MPYFYSDLTREDDPLAQPDVLVTELTAHEVAEHQEELIYQFMKRPEYRLASMNSEARDAMLDAIVEEEGLTGGWCWCFCMVGCLPDSSFSLPFKTQGGAVADMRDYMEQYL